MSFGSLICFYSISKVIPVKFAMVNLVYFFYSSGNGTCSPAWNSSSIEQSGAKSREIEYNEQCNKTNAEMIFKSRVNICRGFS
jgi:hypothetical protein